MRIFRAAATPVDNACELGQLPVKALSQDSVRALSDGIPDDARLGNPGKAGSLPQPGGGVLIQPHALHF